MINPNEIQLRFNKKCSTRDDYSRKSYLFSILEDWVVRWHGTIEENRYCMFIYFRVIIVLMLKLYRGYF